MNAAFALPTRFTENTYRFVRHAIERRTHKERFIKVGKTDSELVYSEGLMQLRYYPHTDTEAFQLDDQLVTVTAQRHKTPILLVPPLGVFGWVYDLMAERSWVRFLNAKGFEVYLVDWGAPEKQHSGLDLNTYVNQWLSTAVDKALSHNQASQVSLVGYCMGGLLTLLYSGLQEDDKVRNVVTVASPIDFHASHFYGVLLDKLAKGTEKLPFNGLDLNHELFHVPGDVLSFLFKMTNPLASVINYFDLIKNLYDRDYVTEHLTVGEWFSNMPDYPGATVQQVMFDFGLKNRLAKGTMRLGDQISDLTSIKANLLAFAGKTDNIVSISAAEKIMELVASEDKTFRVVPGGHAGVFAGGKARNHTWALTADWLAERSD